MGESEKRKIEDKVKLIQEFDMFKQLSRNKLKGIYRFFFSKDKNQEPYKAKRGQYLYKQGDSINGIFCILQGSVQRIKENWQVDQPYDVMTTSRSNSNINYTDVTGSSQNVTQNSTNQLGVMNAIRRRCAEQVIISIVEPYQVVGIEEILLK